MVFTVMFIISRVGRGGRGPLPPQGYLDIVLSPFTEIIPPFVLA